MARKKSEQPPTLKEIVDAAERGALLDALVQTQGSRRAAAKRLSVPERTFHRLLERHGLAETLAAMAKEHNWPGQTARAQEAWRAMHADE